MPCIAERAAMRPPIQAVLGDKCRHLSTKTERKQTLRTGISRRQWVWFSFRGLCLFSVCCQVIPIVHSEDEGRTYVSRLTFHPPGGDAPVESKPTKYRYSASYVKLYPMGARGEENVVSNVTTLVLLDPLSGSTGWTMQMEAGVCVCACVCVCVCVSIYTLRLDQASIARHECLFRYI